MIIVNNFLRISDKFKILTKPLPKSKLVNTSVAKQSIFACQSNTYGSPYPATAQAPRSSRPLLAMTDANANANAHNKNITYLFINIIVIFCIKNTIWPMKRLNTFESKLISHGEQKRARFKKPAIRLERSSLPMCPWPSTAQSDAMALRPRSAGVLQAWSTARPQGLGASAQELLCQTCRPPTLQAQRRCPVFSPPRCQAGRDRSIQQSHQAAQAEMDSLSQQQGYSWCCKEHHCQSVRRQIIGQHTDRTRDGSATPHVPNRCWYRWWRCTFCHTERWQLH